MRARIRTALRVLRSGGIAVQMPPAGEGRIVLLRNGLYVAASMDALIMEDPSMVARCALEMANALNDAVNPDLPADGALCDAGEECGGPEDCICNGTCPCDDEDE